VSRAEGGIIVVLREDAKFASPVASSNNSSYKNSRSPSPPSEYDKAWPASFFFTGSGKELANEFYSESLGQKISHVSDLPLEFSNARRNVSGMSEVSEDAPNYFPNISANLAGNHPHHYNTDSVEYHPQPAKESWSAKLNRFALEHFDASIPIMNEALHIKTQSVSD
jgi:hypothetical protein